MVSNSELTLDEQIDKRLAKIKALPIEKCLATLMERRDAGETFLAANPNNAEGLAAYKRYAYELMEICLDWPDLAQAVWTERHAQEVKQEVMM